MSITLIITRSLDRKFRDTGKSIGLDEWVAIIENDPTLRVRKEPWTAKNPQTGEVISLPVRPGEAEFTCAAGVVPFLGFRRGSLTMRYCDDMDDPKNPVRRKVAEVAERLGALIRHDAGDEFLDWKP